MRGLIVGAIALASVAQAQPDHAVISDPQWIERPTADDLEYLYPSQALKQRSTGQAVLECRVASDGGLEQCRLLSESPAGQGFGDSARYAAALFRMRPPSSKEGGSGPSVRLSLTFAPPDIDTPPERTSSSNIDSSDLEAVWPVAAHGAEGEATLRCTLSVRGSLRDCAVVSELPAGLGFGQAALLLAPSVIYKPATKNGQPVEFPFLLRVRWRGEFPVRSPGQRIGTNLLWSQAPSTAQLMAAYPPRALANKVQGHVVLRCELSAQQLLKSCDVITERPDGYGFAHAAKSLLPLFRSVPLGALPKTVLSQVRVDLPVQFGPLGERYLAKPDWTKQLNPESLLSAFPEKAADAGLSGGRAALDCAVALNGTLADCRIDSEEPPGMGFGPAAVSVAQALAVNPWTDEGVPAEGARIKFSIRFVRKEPDKPAAAPPAAAPGAP